MSLDRRVTWRQMLAGAQADYLAAIARRKELAREAALAGLSKREIGEAMGGLSPAHVQKLTGLTGARRTALDAPVSMPVAPPTVVCSPVHSQGPTRCFICRGTDRSHCMLFKPTSSGGDCPASCPPSHVERLNADGMTLR
jgi:hypothetical protein